MKVDLAIRGGRVIDPATGLDREGTVLVSDERILAIEAPDAAVEAERVIDARGLLVLPGLIDLHTHCFVGETRLGLPPDRIGVQQGVTTVVDAGSSGVDNLLRFRESVRGARTRVLAYINLARDGLARHRGELADPRMLAPDETVEALRAHGGFLVGVKARASASVVRDQGIAPVRLAKETAKRAGVPLMVHIGNAPPRLEEVLELLEAGDIVSHAFHGKKGGIYRDGTLLPEARAALERGVLFDVAHGQASFSYATCRRFLADGLVPHIISSDLWRGNETGPVVSLLHCMSKLLHLGMPLQEVVAATTWRPAVALHRQHEIGSLAPGRIADISIIRQVRGQFPLQDSEGVTEVVSCLLEPVMTIRHGHIVGDIGPGGISA